MEKSLLYFLFFVQYIFTLKHGSAQPRQTENWKQELCTLKKLKSHAAKTNTKTPQRRVIKNERKTKTGFLFYKVQAVSHVPRESYQRRCRSWINLFNVNVFCIYHDGKLKEAVHHNCSFFTSTPESPKMLSVF